MVRSKDKTLYHSFFPRFNFTPTFQTPSPPLPYPAAQGLGNGRLQSVHNVSSSHSFLLTVPLIQRGSSLQAAVLHKLLQWLQSCRISLLQCGSSMDQFLLGEPVPAQAPLHWLQPASGNAWLHQRVLHSGCLLHHAPL